MTRTDTLAICVPSGDQVQTGFATSLAQMVLHLGAQPPPTLSHIVWSWNRSTVLPQSRQKIVEMALAAGATHLLFIDSDMTFPADAAHRLLSHRRPVVGVNASTRRFPLKQLAEKRPGETLATHEDSEGLERAHRIGFGMILLEARVFHDIAEKCGQPFFDFVYLHDEHKFRGEDYFFCEKLHKAGYVPMIDHDLSKQIGHIGQFEFQTLGAAL